MQYSMISTRGSLTRYFVLELLLISLPDQTRLLRRSGGGKSLPHGQPRRARRIRTRDLPTREAHGRGAHSPGACHRINAPNNPHGKPGIPLGTSRVDTDCLWRREPCEEELQGALHAFVCKNALRVRLSGTSRSPDDVSPRLHFS